MPSCSLFHDIIIYFSFVHKSEVAKLDEEKPPKGLDKSKLKNLTTSQNKLGVIPSDRWDGKHIR